MPMNESLQALIDKSFLFKSLDEKGRKLLFESGEEITIYAGTEIITEGDNSDASFYFIKKGSVTVKTGKTGKEVVLASLGPGAIFGEMAFLSGRPRTASVVSDNDCDVIVFSKEKVAKIIKNYPTVVQLMKKIMASRSEATTKKILDGIGHDEVLK